MRVCVHVSLSFRLRYFGTEIFKNRARFVVRLDLDYSAEFHVLFQFTREGRSDTDNNLKIVVRLRTLRLQQRLMLRLGRWCYGRKSCSTTLNQIVLLTWLKWVTSDELMQLLLLLLLVGWPLWHEVRDLIPSEGHLLNFMLFHSILKHLRYEIGLLHLELRR